MPPKPKQVQASFTDIRELSPWNKHFRCSYAGRETVEFAAGQFMMVRLQKEGKLVKRAYSICSVPNHRDYVEFVITRVEGGFVSNWFHERKVGDPIELEGPYGHFVIQEPMGEEIVFACTGSGVAPFRSMIPVILSRNPQKPIWLLLGVRYEDQILYQNEFEALAKQFPNFHFVPTISRPKNWKGEVGYVQEKLKKYVTQPDGKQLYICGLPNMVDDVKKAAEEIGFPKEKVYYEKY